MHRSLSLSLSLSLSSQCVVFFFIDFTLCRTARIFLSLVSLIITTIKKLRLDSSPLSSSARSAHQIHLQSPPPQSLLQLPKPPTESQSLSSSAAPSLASHSLFAPFYPRGAAESAAMPRPSASAFVLLVAVAALVAGVSVAAEEGIVTCSGIVTMRDRVDRISIADFGGVGDGRTLNTKAFREAVYRIRHLHRPGGTLLYVPPGVYLTESFNLTSHMTLYLAKGAVIKATQDTSNWPLIAPLPSYGRGREHPGGRYMSFIHGDDLQDVIITGENGTIDGQGDVWWNMWRQRTLSFTRPNLIELVNSRDIIISNVVFQNSPFWNIHPVYCSNVVVRNVTVLAPLDSPNTDGIDPDSSSNVCIEDSYISVGDDIVSVKSGWDEYGIAYGRPSSDITIRRLTGSSPFAGIAVGSETSGGVENVLAENINLYKVGVGIHLKTNAGRGGFIRNITFSDVYVETARKGIKISGDVGDHPDDNYDPNALPVVKGILIKDVWGTNVQQAGLIRGIKNSPFTGICLSNINLRGKPGPREAPWSCSDVSGAAFEVSPSPCLELTSVSQSASCATYS